MCPSPSRGSGVIRFVVKREHAYTVASLGRNFGFDTPPCSALAYEDLFDAETLPSATYVFADIERLSDAELVVAAEIASAMEGAEGFRVLNHPARVRTRYALLRALHQRGLNLFDAYRADGLPRPGRFPVFVRAEAEHEPALTALLPDQPSLDLALAGLVARGRPLRGLVVIEYCAQEARPGIWRRFGTFRIGDAVQLDHVVTEASWNVKWGTQGLSTEQENASDYRAVLDNLFSEPLREAFDVAAIDYGRADFGIVDGRPQVYEINTNPHLAALADDTSPIRTRSLRLAHERFASHLYRIDTTSGVAPALELSMPRAQALREVRRRERVLVDAMARRGADPEPTALPLGAPFEPDLRTQWAKGCLKAAAIWRGTARILRRLGRRIA